MAKIGEGDKRWIVAERTDGANVAAWHWAERDCLDWSKRRFGELFENVRISTETDNDTSSEVTIVSVQSVSGDAYVNVRKGKIIPGYELNVKLKWEGVLRKVGGEENDKIVVKVEGTVELPYIADENADEDPDFIVSVKENTKESDVFRGILLKKGKVIVMDKVRTVVKELAEGGPAKDEILRMKSGKPPAGEETTKSDATKDSVKNDDVSRQAQVQNQKPKEKAKEKEKEKAGFRTIKMTQQFRCRRRDLYDVLMDERRWMAFTQSKATINPQVGGGFSVFDGSVVGIFQKLETDSVIVKKWRFNSWADGLYSTVCITLEEPEEGTTILKLTQTNIPEEDRYGNSTVYETTERGWRDLIFHKIRAVFGYGI